MRFNQLALPVLALSVDYVAATYETNGGSVSIRSSLNSPIMTSVIKDY